MKISRGLWIAIIVLIVWLALAWMLGSWLGLKPPGLYYLRGGLWLIGAAGFAGYLLLRPKQTDAPAPGAAAGANQEIDYNFAEAAKRLQAARGVKRLGSLPAVFLLGDSDSAKTSVVAKSGIEAELLAGQAFQEYLVTPTRALNLWYARNTLFIDPAGAVMADAAARRKLFKKFAPIGVHSVMGAKTPASRAVVFTVDCDTFLQAGGADALAAKARQFQSVLAELSQEMGSSFPVYVLFTKADKIGYFRDYVENFTEQEAADIFGVTVPMQADAQGGYAEQQTRRLSDHFQGLYHSFADKRTVYLAREHHAAGLPNIYEFPREFAKLRPLLVQFLVDLCRPSQLGTSPFLRGFYFTGVRPVAIADVTPAAQLPPTDDGGFDDGATRMFNLRGRAAPMAAEAGEAGARKTAQWVFLQRLFPEVILADRQANAAAQSNVKLNLARRLLFACAAGAALLMAIWWSVSYYNNSKLVHDATEAARAIPAVSSTPGQLASSDSLQRLTGVKDTLATLNGYAKNGAPLSYGALLYAGEAIREPLRATYYAFFRRILLAPTQQTLIGICSRPEAYEAQGYRYVYDALKAYLITTNHHEKSTPEFLAPTLFSHWKNDQQIDNQRENLALQNLQFYAEGLPEANPYPRFANPDSTAVEAARAYLKRFAQLERIYQSMLVAAGEGQKPIVFNTDYPGSAETVINSYKVDSAFTKAGFLAFQKQLQNPDKYFSGEEWVLGPMSSAEYDRAKLVQDLGARYQQEFIKTWQDYLKATSVVGYGGIPDAARKLEKLSGPQSSLLQALCVASESTSVPNKDVAQAFQPVQFVTPPNCSHQLVAAANNGYLQQLIGLKGALQTVGPIDRADAGSVAAASSSATLAENAVSTLALGFTADANDPKSPVLAKTTQLLKDPILRVLPMLKAPVGLGANEGAGNLCKSIAPMLAKYPFNPRATTDATLQEVNDFLKPQEGRLWQLYNGALKQYLIPAGDGFVAAVGGPQGSVTPAFLNFFNRAARISRAFYKGETAQSPNFSFSMQPLPAQDVDHVTLSIDGQILSADVRSGAKAETFAWPGGSQGVNLQVRFGASPEFTIVQTSGLWAVWHFLDTGERMPGGSALELQWVQKTSAGPATINGHPAAVKFALDPLGAQILRPQYFSGFACVSKAVQ
jgi:type VI secretion system protein ImpL